MSPRDWDTTSILLILPDNTALRFMSRARPARPVFGARQNRGLNMAEIVRSLMPRIDRIRPIPSVLPSGQRVALMSPRTR